MKEGTRQIVTHKSGSLLFQLQQHASECALPQDKELLLSLIFCGQVAVVSSSRSGKQGQDQCEAGGAEEFVRDHRRRIPKGTRILLYPQRKKYVSRGGQKLEQVLKAWEVPVSGRIWLDCGASTGGFTDCLLRYGATCVYAVDVGHNQLDYRLQVHPRVRSLERSNVMDLAPEDFLSKPPPETRHKRAIGINSDPPSEPPIAYPPRSFQPPATPPTTPHAAAATAGSCAGDPPDPPPATPHAAVVDLSFRSLRGALAHLLPLVSDRYILALCKPQFELAAHRDEMLPQEGEGFSGVVESRHLFPLLMRTLQGLSEEQVYVQRILPAAIRGRKGNQEFFLEVREQAPRKPGTALASYYTELLQGLGIQQGT